MSDITDKMAIDVLKERYFLDGEKSWDDLVWRVSFFIGNNEEEREKYFELISDRRFIPNSPTLMNAGTNNGGLSACYVIGIEDSIEGIGKAITNSMLISKSGGGVGYTFGHLRPRGSIVKSTNGVASGPVSFMKIFDTATNSIKQGGKRRGANMGVLPVSHPDIREFIHCKEQDGELSNFNISVGITDKFMNAAINGTTYYNDADIGIDPHALLKEIAHAMWDNGEPGVLFLDTINADNTYDEPIEACNPCVTGDTLVLTSEGNIPIEQLVGRNVEIWNGYEWSIVTPYYTGVNDIVRIKFSNKCQLDCTPYHKFILKNGERVEASELKVGNTLIEYELPVIEGTPSSQNSRCIKIVSVEPLNNQEKTYCLTEPKNHSMVVNGVLTAQCGEEPLISDSSCNLGSIDVSRYVIDNDVDFTSLARDIKTAVWFLNGVIDKNCYPLKEIDVTTRKYRPIGLGIMGFADALIKMRMIYGSAESLKFASTLMGFIRECADLEANEYARIHGTRRNVTTTSIAPTGSISMFAGCSSGIEPNFAFEYTRRVKAMSGEYEEYTVKHHLAEDYDMLPPEFITAFEVTPEQHIDMQAALQKYCDTGVSKTINVPNDASENNVIDYIIRAWQKGCKGMTMYRDGSRDSQVLSVPTEPKNDEPIKIANDEPSQLARPTALRGMTYKKHSGCGKLFITVTERDGKPYEVFVQTAGVGGCQANSEALGRAISVGLRNGVQASEYIKQLSRVICPKCKDKHVDGKSCADIVGKCLKDEISNPFTIEERCAVEDSLERHKDAMELLGNDSPRCPECGAPINMIEGCMTCPSCGYSKCS